jgi:hypothetical protein
MTDNYNKELDRFMQEYSIHDIKYMDHPVFKFRYACFRMIEMMQKIKLPEVAIRSNRESVIVEFRYLPHLEFLIRNTIYKLGNGWSHTIICGNLNYDLIYRICNEISPNINIIKMDYDNIDINKYNNMLLTVDFWNLLHGEKILIYQEDTIIFKNNVSEFLEYDYIGAPWVRNETDTISPRVGNGGFSLRNRNVMIQILSQYNPNVFNDTQHRHGSGIRLDYVAEDLFIAIIMTYKNIGKIADVSIASNFSTEDILNRESFGGHRIWNSDPIWIERIDKLMNEYKIIYMIQ